MENVKVRHKVTGEAMTVKKDYGDVVTCWIEKAFVFNINILIDTVICSKDNLIYEVKMHGDETI